MRFGVVDLGKIVAMRLLFDLKLIGPRGAQVTPPFMLSLGVFLEVSVTVEQSGFGILIIDTFFILFLFKLTQTSKGFMQLYIICALVTYFFLV